MNEVEIVPASTADIEEIQKIDHNTWPETFGHILSDRQIVYMLEMMYSTPSLTTQMETEGHNFVLARENGQSLGYASFELNYQNLNKTKIHKIYVLPQTQGKGLGKNILNHISRMAKNKAEKKISLNVNRDNKAVKFYEHLGFMVVGKADIPIGNGFIMEDFIMEKDL